MVISALLLQPRLLLVVSRFRFGWLQCSLLISKVLRVPIIPYCVRIEGRIEGVNGWVGGWVGGGTGARLTTALFLLGVKKYASLMYPSR